MDKNEVVIKLHDCRRYLEDKEWSDSIAGQHIEVLNNAIALLKEQEAAEPRWFIDAHNPAGAFRCGACGERIIEKNVDFYCSKCGKPILWEGR